MDAKYAGERALMATTVPYTIVRPGALRSGSTAAEPLSFGQDDGDIANGTSGIDRSDVARVVLDAIAVGPRNVTFEVVAARARPAGTASGTGSGSTVPTDGAAGVSVASGGYGVLGSPAVQATLRTLNPDARA